MTTKLIATDSPKYLRRLRAAINAQRYGQPMYVQLTTEPEARRVRSARFVDGHLEVRTIGSDMWFCATAEQLSGVAASCVA